MPQNDSSVPSTLENTALNHILLHRAVMSFITSAQMFIFRLMSTRLQDTILQWTLPHLIHRHLKFNTPNTILMTPPWLSVICIPRTKEGILQNGPKNNSLKWLTPNPFLYIPLCPITCRKALGSICLMSTQAIFWFGCYYHFLPITSLPWSKA